MLIGPVIAERTKINKMRFLLFWILLGAISSLFPIVIPISGKYEVSMLLVFWGFAFGIGFPSCLALIPFLTTIEERGRVSGTILLATYVTSFLLIFTIRHLSIFPYTLILAAWRSLGLAAVLSRVSLNRVLNLRPVSYFSILRCKKFFLYFFPWLAFCLINYFENQVFGEFFGTSMLALISTMELLVGSFFGFVSGWLMDSKGRRWMIIIGLVMLGLGYISLSFFPQTTFIQAFFVIVDGIAFGIFAVAFMFVIWGDISNGRQGDKFYALGTISVPAATALSLFISPWLKTISASSAFSLAGFFIFLAIIPIFFAPELLPEKVLKRRELREYVEKVKKIVGREQA
jgi:MFS family permease